MTGSAIVLDPLEIETRRRERERRLTLYELPRLRVGGSVLLSFGVLLHNRYLVPLPDAYWLRATIVLGLYAILAWAAVVFFYRRTPSRDLTLATLVGDLFVWTYVVYCSGAESSWLFFILLLRVADQTQTTFRRACAFALVATGCYAAMLMYIEVADGRDVINTGQMGKLAVILLASVYVSLAARTSENRRARLAEAIRVSRDLIRRLEQAHARAEEASAAKSEFVANMSHEMRTPLQAVIGMLQLAIEDEQSQSKSRRLLTARRSAETLLSMIDDVLDFSRIEARKLELEPVYFNVRQLLHDTMKSVGIMAASKRLTLSYFVHPDVPDTVWADPVRLRQILVNLIGNAIKFTHAGEISVTVARAGDKARIDVRDTGVGIAPAVRQRIFEPFAQADSSHSRSYGGTGLGLSIVARLLEAMGGTVQVLSEQGSGSVFSFSIPLTTDAIGASPERKPWESGLQGKAILVVEPEEMARAALAQILRSRGVFASAFSRMSDVPPQARFACAITADTAVGVRPQVVVTSPLDTTNYTVRVTRPVGERELIDAVGVALGLAEQPPEYTLEPELAEARSCRVLLVDDSEVNLEVVSEMIRRLGHSVTVAVDGESALEKLSSESFDVVFMDVQLPGMDGLETTRRFRDSGKRTPVIALTAHTAMRDRDRCLAAGMNAVLTKPVDSTHLSAAIEKVTHRDAIAEVVGGNMALLARVRDAFTKQTPELLQAIREALSRRDGAALARHAHKLKGSMSYFPGERGAEIARQIELAARDEDFIRAAGLLPDLERAIGDLERALSV